MPKLLFLSFLLIANVAMLHAVDSDYDGVEDRLDRCPATPILEFSNQYGCSTSQKEDSGRMMLALGVRVENGSYDDGTNVQTQSGIVQLGYWNGSWGVELFGSYYNVDAYNPPDRGLNDTEIIAYYKFNPLTDLTLYFGGGVILPTYDDVSNQTDYPLFVRFFYDLEVVGLYGGYRHTFIGDTDDAFYDYRDTNTYDIGVGRPLVSKLRGNLSYVVEESSYLSDTYESASLGLTWGLSDTVDLHYTYSKGLNSTTYDEVHLIKCSYYF